MKSGSVEDSGFLLEGKDGTGSGPLGQGRVLYGVLVVDRVVQLVGMRELCDLVTSRDSFKWSNGR